MNPQEHDKYNAIHYPGTRQICCKCDEPTERCEEDAMWSEDGDFEGLPLCTTCYHKEQIALNKESEG